MKTVSERYQTNRFGISLVELLVVIAILAIAVAMLLPGVQNVRLAALRAETANRFRQVGIATHNYASAHSGQLPNVDGHKPNQGISVLDALRPHIEADTTFDVRPLPDHPDINLAYIPLFISPSDPSLSSIPETVGDTSLAVSVPVFSRETNLSRSFSDGLSNTIGYSEHYARCNTTGFSWSFLRSVCQNASGNIIPCVNPGTHRATFSDPMYDDIVPTQEVSSKVTFQVRPPVKECDYRLLQATHPNTLITVMMDGHVRWFKPGVSPQVFWACTTPRGGEAATED